MREDTFLEIVLKIRMALKRRRTTKENIMLALHKMMILPGRESNKKVKILQVMKNMFWSLLSRELSHMEEKIGLLTVTASKHMTGFKEYFLKLSEHNSPHKVKLGDDYQYPIKGSGESSYKLDSGKSMNMKDVLFVPD